MGKEMPEVRAAMPELLNWIEKVFWVLRLWRAPEAQS